MTGELIRAANLKVYFQTRTGIFRTKTVKAVDDVSISIARGETLGLVGESGSGKTTLGRALVRLVEPAGGTISYDGRKITTLDVKDLKAFRQRAQIVFQDPYSSISPFMTVREIVEEPLHIHGIGRREERQGLVLQALETVNLSPAADIAPRHPHNLSGGQRQRVCIARAIVLRPGFVIADEPVSMVDASNRTEILNLLRQLQQEQQVSFLYITHDIASARHFSDRIAVMYLGTIVEIGDADTVIGAPKHPYTIGLLNAVPEPDPENRKILRSVIPGEPPNASDVPTGCPFHPRCPHAIKGMCEVVRPALEKIDGNREVACHLHGGNV